MHLGPVDEIGIGQEREGSLLQSERLYEETIAWHGGGRDGRPSLKPGIHEDIN